MISPQIQAEIDMQPLPIRQLLHLQYDSEARGCQLGRMVYGYVVDRKWAMVRAVERYGPPKNGTNLYGKYIMHLLFASGMVRRVYPRTVQISDQESGYAFGLMENIPERMNIPSQGKIDALKELLEIDRDPEWYPVLA